MANMTPDILSNLAIIMGWKPYGEDNSGGLNTMASMRAKDMLSGNRNGFWGPQVMGYKDGGGGAGEYGDYGRRQLPMYEALMPSFDQSGALDFLRNLGSQRTAQEDPYTVHTNYRLPYDPAELYRNDVANSATMRNPALNGWL